VEMNPAHIGSMMKSCTISSISIKVMDLSSDMWLNDDRYTSMGIVRAFSFALSIKRDPCMSRGCTRVAVRMMFLWFMDIYGRMWRRTPMDELNRYHASHQTCHAELPIIFYNEGCSKTAR